MRWPKGWPSKGTSSNPGSSFCSLTQNTLRSGLGPAVVDMLDSYDLSLRIAHGRTEASGGREHAGGPAEIYWAHSTSGSSGAGCWTARLRRFWLSRKVER